MINLLQNVLYKINKRKNVKFSKYLCIFALTIYILLITSSAILASITVSVTTDATTIARQLQGKDVTISNVSINQGIDTTNNNHINQVGIFTGGKTGGAGPVLNIEDGVVLVTGDAATAIGPNNSSNLTTGGEEGPTNSSLATVDSGAQYDTVSLEFNVVPNGNVLSMDFVFASEEYNEYVCTIFNDAMGIFVTGPGITGEVNIARVGANLTNLSINEVNRGVAGAAASNSPAPCKLNNTEFYVNNIVIYDELNEPITNTNTSTTFTNLQYDGFTKPLSATVRVQPNQTYTVKVVTADIGDASWDGAVFLDGVNSYDLDYGDAPNSYGTTGVDQAIQLPGPARHSVLANPVVYLGNIIPDLEGNGTAATSPNLANSDDLTGQDDEDALSDNLIVSSASTTHTISNIPVRNTSGKTAQLMGWIDFNRDGDFLDVGEQAVVNVAANQTSANLTWSGFSTSSLGVSYARFRITTDPNLIAAPSPLGLAIDGEVEDYRVEILPVDFGDAPASFGNASHNIPSTSTIYLGSVQPDAETATQLDTDNGASALGDDNNGIPDDEDAFTTLPNVSTIDNYDITVPLRNTSGSSATLHAWIDFNKNGTFESGEYKSVTVANNSTRANLNWAIPSGTTPGDTYVRFRLTSDSLINSNTPSGAARNGEVEDYKVTIEPVPSLPPVSIGACEVAITNGGFESPALNVTPPTPFQIFEAGKIAAYYENDVPGWTSFADSFIELWRNGNTSSGSPTAYEGNQFAELNAYTNGTLYQDVYTIPGAIISWQFAHRGRLGVDTMNLRIGSPGATVAQINPTTGNTSFTTNNTGWVVYQGTYTVPAGQTTTRFEYRAVSTSTRNPSVGNLIDAVYFGPLCDHGDASSNYPVLRSNNGAAHVNNGVTYLGTKIRTELDGMPTTAANGDDGIAGDSDQVDDEDGVTFPPTLNTGRNTPVSVVASAPGYLNAWIDFNQDNDWNDPGEKIFTDRSLSAGQNNLSFLIPATANGGNTYARFRYSSNTGISPTGIATDGEVEDYQIALALSVPKLLLVKRITAINPGQSNQLVFNGFVNDPITTDDDHPNWPNNDDLYLRGRINVSNVKPGDEVEYTIYFLSYGDVGARNVNICDAIPDNMTFVGNSYGSNFGMALALDDTTLPTTTNINLSNALGDDQGDFIPPNIDPAISNLCKRHDPNNPDNLIPLNSSNNVSGAVIIKLNTPLPPATTPGIPPNSYGFIRFRGKVK